MNGIDYLLDLNRRNSREFIASGLDRKRYRALYPTEITALKCMDGRLHLPVTTNTLMGIIQPYRNIGGRFNLGWPFFNILISGWKDYITDRGRDGLVLATYHFSRGNEHRGCAGFNYDTHAAESASRALRDQFNEVFQHHTVFAIQIGIETDEDAILFHGTNGGVLDLSRVEKNDNEEILAAIQNLYPDIPLRVVKDLIPIVSGNIEHIRKIRDSKRPIQEAEHRESIIGVGRGFDWLHEPNIALLIGPYDPKFEQAITTAAKVVFANIEAGRIDPKNGVVLLTAAPYREPSGPDQEIARVKAQEQQKQAREVIEQTVPELLPHLQYLTVTVDMGTRAFNFIQRS